MRNRLATRLIATALAVSLTGCFGSFKATVKLYDWNKGISSNGIVQSLVFWGLNIIPVYGILGLGDLVIFNLIETWTGSNPLAAADSMEIVEGVARIERDGRVLTIEPTPDGRFVIAMDGERLGEASLTPAGDLSVLDAASGTTVVVPAEQIEALRMQFAGSGTTL